VNLKGVLKDFLLWGLPLVLIVNFVLWQIIPAEHYLVHFALSALLGWQIGSALEKRNRNAGE
jgi:hypothetical protein